MTLPWSGWSPHIPFVHVIWPQSVLVPGQSWGVMQIAPPLLPLLLLSLEVLSPLDIDPLPTLASNAVALTPLPALPPAPLPGHFSKSSHSFGANKHPWAQAEKPSVTSPVRINPSRA